MRCWWCNRKMHWTEDVDLDTGLAAVLCCEKCGAIATVEQPIDLDEEW